MAHSGREENFTAVCDYAENWQTSSVCFAVSMNYTIVQSFYDLKYFLTNAGNTADYSRSLWPDSSNPSPISLD